MPYSKGLSLTLFEMEKTKVSWSVLTSLTVLTNLSWSYWEPKNDLGSWSVLTKISSIKNISVV